MGAIRSTVLVLICLSVGYVFAAGSLNRYTRQFDEARPGTFLLGSALAPNGLPGYGDQQANKPSGSRWANAVHTKSEMRPAALVPIQSKDAKDLGVGKLLVASRSLADPNFAKTVILLIRSDDHGFVGLILNRRTDIPLSRVFEDFSGAKDRSDPVYLGGPVEVPTVTALLQSPGKIEGADRIFSGVYFISTKTLLEQTIAGRPDPQVFHVYLGYAGWAPDQLRKEVELGAWFVLPADTGTVFSSDPGFLWPQMIRKTEQKVAGNLPANQPVKPLLSPNSELNERKQRINKPIPKRRLITSALLHLKQTKQKRVPPGTLFQLNSPECNILATTYLESIFYSQNLPVTPSN